MCGLFNMRYFKIFQKLYEYYSYIIKMINLVLIFCFRYGLEKVVGIYSKLGLVFDFNWILGIFFFLIFGIS